MVWRKVVPVTVTSSGNDGNFPLWSIDSKLETRWSQNLKGAWLLYDLGSILSVHVVDIAWYRGTDRKSKFFIEASNDGITNWKPIFGDANNLKESTGVTNDPQRCDIGVNIFTRFIRINFFGVTYNDGVTPAADWASVTEVMVYGDDSDAPPDPDTITLEIKPTEVVQGTDSTVAITGSFFLGGSKITVASYSIDLMNETATTFIARIKTGVNATDFSTTYNTKALALGKYSVRVSSPSVPAV